MTLSTRWRASSKRSAGGNSRAALLTALTLL
jgi:hypothetical protein